MPDRRLVFRLHAVRRMIKRHVDDAHIRAVLVSGEVIQRYPDDLPFASRLVLGWVDAGPLHVVVADNPIDNETIVITVYEPDPDRWSDDFRTRRRR